VYFKTNKENDFRELTSWENGTLPIDSSTCNNAPSVTACDQYRELSRSSDYTRVSYYWYTKYTERSSTDYNDYSTNGYNDSTSITNVWYVQNAERVSYTEYSNFIAEPNSGKTKATRTVYLWLQKDTLKCEISFSDYENYGDYAYELCDAYATSGYYSPSQTINTGLETVYRTYLWYVDKTPVAYDSCEATSGSYSSCPQYSAYGYYYTTTTNYYIMTPVDSSFCSTAGSYSYAYETQCEQYTTFKKGPDAQRTVYWDKVPTDSVSCSIASGSDMRYDSKCDSLIRTFAVNESYLTGYINGNNYYYDDYGNYINIYNSNRYNSNSSNYTYVWYTKYANKRPIESDSLAFINNNQIFTSDEITTASFIVLPYVSINGETFTSNVAEADSVTIKH
jgi:hypothetical protein